MAYVASSCSADSAYQINGKRVVIKGKANVSNGSIVTPQGVTTFVDSSTLKELHKHNSFSRKIASGFYQVISDKKDGKKAGKDMVKDKSAQSSGA